MEKFAPVESDSVSSTAPGEAGGTTAPDSPSSQLPSEVKSEVAVKVFRSQRGLLLNLMRHCLPSLANSLLSRNVIPKDVFEDACNQTVNKSQRCADLLECMEDIINASPSTFIEIIKVLELEPFLEKLTFELVHHYNCTKSSSSVDSCPPLVSSAISRYRAYLKAVYSNSSVSQDSKWPPTPSREYIDLAVVEGRHKIKEDYIGHTLQGNVRQVLKKRNKISINQILPNLPKCDSEYIKIDIKNNSKELKHFKYSEKNVSTHERLILIEGAPGIGKSTLAWELCRKWEEFPSMQQYSLVVLLRLREAEVQKIEGVGDLFSSYESEDKKLLLKEVMESQGKGVLFILDGFDELPSDFQSKGYLRDLIRDSALPESTVLVTSRPSATAKLLTSCRPDKHIEILGFTQESVEAYASSVFNSQPDQLGKFKAFISASNNPAINSLMYVPLNAAIIVQVFCDAESDSFLPHTLTELYTRLCITILNRHLKVNCPSIRVDTFKDLPPKMYNQFLELSQLAFEGREKDEVIFHNLPPDFVHFGFLDAVSALYGGGGVSCNFLHLTLQEFLAAYYISTLDAETIKSFIQSKSIRSFLNLTRWNVTVRFLVGLTTYLDGIEVYEGGINSEHCEASTFFLQCLFEAQGQKKHIPPYNLKLPLTLSVYNLSELDITTPLDWYVMGYCIANLITGGSLKVVIRSSVELQPFVSGLRTRVPCVGNFKELHIVKSEYRETFYSLCDLLPSHLSSLHFIDCVLKHNDLVHLSQVIKQLVCLTELSLGRSESMQHGYTKGYLEILQSLSQTNVSTLTVVNTGVYKFATRSLISALEQLIHPSHGKLKTLYIGDVGKHQNCRPYQCKILEILSANSSLNYLHLSNPCQSSLHLLANNACLTELHVYCYKPSRHFFQGIEKIVTSNKNLEHMFLSFFHKAEHARTIAELFIRNNTTMHTLRLGLKHIKPTDHFTIDSRVVYMRYNKYNSIKPWVPLNLVDQSSISQIQMPTSSSFLSRPFFQDVLGILIAVLAAVTFYLIADEGHTYTPYKIAELQDMHS